jgi:hypothetical protein
MVPYPELDRPSAQVSSKRPPPGLRSVTAFDAFTVTYARGQPQSGGISLIRCYVKRTAYCPRFAGWSAFFDGLVICCSVRNEMFSFEACTTTAPFVRPSRPAIREAGILPARLFIFALSSSVHGLWRIVPQLRCVRQGWFPDRRSQERPTTRCLKTQIPHAGRHLVLQMLPTLTFEIRIWGNADGPAVLARFEA